MIRGSCLCGAVTWEADALAGPIGHCHCRTCQKAHGAAFATTARAMRAAFRWTRGDEARRSFESSPGKLRWFCSRCGSQLMAEWTAQDQVILRIGSVDAGIEGVKPVAHIWVSHQAEWDPGPDDQLPRYAEGAPPAR
ncbi:MAG TPA: GFA family protein [Caulobacteraceae bacterium]|jgi:hypothetical protein